MMKYAEYGTYLFMKICIFVRVHRIYGTFPFKGHTALRIVHNTM